jgi:cytochrome c-type biogenesis protein CcmF
VYFSDLGTIALILAFGFAVFTLIFGVVGGIRAHVQDDKETVLRNDGVVFVEVAKRSTLVVTALLILASIALIASFLTHDFGVRYVAEQSSITMPWYYVTAAFYGGQEGSLLYWGLMLAVFSAIFVLTSKRAPAALVPYVLATLMGIEAFFLLVLTSVSNPFVRLPGTPPANGVGLNPLLMDPGMLVHPPMLLMGYMSFSVPFAFAVAAMLSGTLDSAWLRSIRRWTLAAWTIQTAGLILGAWWAYHVLGWGGYWGWDPVENAALLPWLTATAFLHSTMVQERRGMLKVWNLCLIIASFALSIFGTFEVRSGIISSVHSFAYSSIGIYFLVFLVVVVLFSTGLFLYRLPRLKPEQEFDSVVSREGVFLLNNLLLVGITFATLWGTLFPLLTAALKKQTLSVGPPFYNNVNGPLFALLILTMGIGPLLGWRRTALRSLWRNLSVPALCAALCAVILPLTGVTNVLANIGFSVCVFTAGAIFYELWRGVRVRHAHGEPYIIALFMLFNRYRQRYGGYVVHLGLVLLAVGVIGSHFFQQQKDVTLKAGQQTEFAGTRVVYFGNIDEQLVDREIITAQLQLWRNGQLQEYVYPSRTLYKSFQNQPASQISITTQSGFTDFYVFLEDFTGPGQATLHIFLNPLTSLVWEGGVLMLLGGVLCWWPERRKVVVAQRVVPAKAPKEVLV